MSKRGGKARIERRTDPLMQCTLAELRAAVAGLELDNYRVHDRAETAEIAERCADARARHVGRRNAQLCAGRTIDRRRIRRLIGALRGLKRLLLAAPNDAHESNEKRAPIADVHRRETGAAA